MHYYQQRMVTVENKTNNISLVKKLIECYNSNDPKQLSACDSICSSNLQFHDPANPSNQSGLQGLKTAESNYMMAFPNKSGKTDAIFGIEDRVVVRWTLTGTHKGPFQGILPTNKSFKISGITIYRISDNKITEIWQSWDTLGLLEQLGVVKQPAMR